MTEYEPLPGFLYYKGRKFICPCGNSDFKVEIKEDPVPFWCTCGAMYTEYTVDMLGKEREEVSG